MAFIKSHSNYVLRKNHQSVSDGTIWERDITTIGGVNQFAPGQTPIYKSSNFIITVRSDNKIANQYNTSKWEENGSGDVWTMQTVSGLSSELNGQNDTQIVLKQDYYDLRDFAYYGSLSELMRASITDIISRFPGELYITDKNAYYTSSITEDFESIEQRIQLGIVPVESAYKISHNGWELTSSTENTLSSLKYVDNPFSIDIHSVKKPQDANALKFFTNLGYKNYQIIRDNSESGKTIEQYQTQIIIKRLRYLSHLDEAYHSYRLYYTIMRDAIQNYWENNDGVLWSITLDENGKAKEDKANYDRLSQWISTEVVKEYQKIKNLYWIEKALDNGCELVDGDYSTLKECEEALKDLNSNPETSGDTYYIKSGKEELNPLNYILVTENICQGYCAAITQIDGIKIEAWIGDNGEIVYLSDESNSNIHIRPINSYWTEFYNSCDSFEKLLINPKTTPKYQATFSVIQENENGYFQEVQSFVFPKSFGDYNIDASTYGYSDYTTQLADIGAYYDERFSDNLYRSMTHEAIKNFDWTYTREFNVGDDEEYKEGGEKIQKALRLFAREFDEILIYINNIKNVNTVTYDEKNNLPDYFLTDALSNKGWDVKLIYPYSLSEYITNDDGTKEYINSYILEEQLENKHGNNYITRLFNQDSTREVIPYSKNNIDEALQDGYFIVCDSSSATGQLCEYKGSPYFYKTATENETTYYDESISTLKNRIKSYTSEKKYTFFDINNSFLRRMIINSNHIWRHKGTIEGVEMILSMFGLHSKKWVDSLNSKKKECKKYHIDYNITEYTSFTPPIEETWDAVHQMYRIDWINSTKAIVYDYRSVSNYTQYGASTDYITYQGLPVVYRDDNNMFLKPTPSGQVSTSSATEAFKDINLNNSPVRKRYLYPNFNSDEQIDGNMYFQMNGGWLAKTVSNDEAKYNFQYDLNNNIAYTYFNSNYTEGDNEYLYLETLRNIKRVETLNELLATSINNVKKGSIYFVSNVDEKTAVINNALYPINEEYVSGDTYAYYISLVKNDEYISIGDDLFFSDTIAVYDINGIPTLYNIADKEQGFEVKAYVFPQKDIQFICQDSIWGTSDGQYVNGSAYGIDNFVILSAITSNDSSNYFILTDEYSPNRIATDYTKNGWLRLSIHDPNYIKVNTVTNYYNGNNPHNGNLRYDNGHEYFTYFKRLFKYSIDNGMFDERCYESFYHDLDTEISKYGFTNLIDNDESYKFYQPYLIPDSKIHYFGNYYDLQGQNVKYSNVMSNDEGFYNFIERDKYFIGENPYQNLSQDIKDKSDGVTNQIMNNKRITIDFYLHFPWHSKDGQEEVKYLDSIVMGYLTQMIPSTSILDVNYCYKSESND